MSEDEKQPEMDEAPKPIPSLEEMKAIHAAMVEYWAGRPITRKEKP